MIHKIKLTGLRVFAHHGVFEFEKEQGQDFFIDATVWVDAEKATENDDIAATVHYGELADAIVADAKSRPVDLIETLAERILFLILEWGGSSSPVLKAKVTVHKPNAPIAHEFKDVSVTVKGKRTEGPKHLAKNEDD
ncbi:MAG: hypothetical protein RI933_593 [Actinomycetota bacterium]|jgi:dihydroneopterin aldolase|uniref:7,8-dihydroneopterin aldolase n=1 Tax=Candidatus Rhodoluna planktonica TaxID=535712 RepID=A0A1D9DXM7_9MICO|nr:dihydroneopterin aldolase [Candidatus Rhodoluna planktonica]AOY55562.1 hypothetical protein A4Z71_00660 [Candidatus Rhodoluna planktonica]